LRLFAACQKMYFPESENQTCRSLHCLKEDKRKKERKSNSLLRYFNEQKSLWTGYHLNVKKCKNASFLQP